MKKVVISCGPIPARLDSVKFLTNRFKGGLAFETARRLAKDAGLAVTIVKWKHTPLPWKGEEISEAHIADVVNVNDVVEYAKWFHDYAAEYDAFVMAAAVANLMPSRPYENKFPSHLYKVGEKFDIQFEIAPRAIDIIKRVNPRCCLIGYKLFDAASDEELIDIARHTLEDAKANVVFANTPKDAKSRKIAITADGAAIEMDFDQHVEFIKKAIHARYFKTKVSGQSPVEACAHGASSGALRRLSNGFALVKYFEKTFPHFGTIAIRVPGIGMVTTSRGHKNGPVLVTDVNFFERTVTCVEEKATLNAPLLWRMLQENPGADYIIHRHFDDPAADAYADRGLPEVDYEFPGTADEAAMADRIGEWMIRETVDPEPETGFSRGFVIRNHGYMIPGTFKDVDWNKYYEMFPERYFGTRNVMNEILRYAEEHPELMSLEVGGNSTCRCRYNLDPYMEGDNVVAYGDLPGMKFDIIVARNSINYLSSGELTLVLSTLKEDGVFIANGFANPPDVSIRPESHEVAVKHPNPDVCDLIEHFLMAGDDIYTHCFYGRGAEDYRRLGFDVHSNGRSIIISKGDFMKYNR